MNCFVCDSQGRGEAAVATCPTCTVGLCRKHLDEARGTAGPGGAQYRCNHVSLRAAAGAGAR